MADIHGREPGDLGYDPSTDPGDPLYGTAPPDEQVHTVTTEQQTTTGPGPGPAHTVTEETHSVTPAPAAAETTTTTTTDDRPWLERKRPLAIIIAIVLALLLLLAAIGVARAIGRDNDGLRDRNVEVGVATGPDGKATTQQPADEDSVKPSEEASERASEQPSAEASTQEPTTEPTAAATPADCTNPSVKQAWVGTPLRLQADSEEALEQIDALAGSGLKNAMYFGQFTKNMNPWLDRTSCRGFYSTVEVDNAFAKFGGMNDEMSDWLGGFKDHEHLQYLAMSTTSSGADHSEFNTRADWLRDQTGKQIMCFVEYPDMAPGPALTNISSYNCDIHLVMYFGPPSELDVVGDAITQASIDGSLAIGVLMGYDYGSGLPSPAELGEAAGAMHGLSPPVNGIFIYTEGDPKPGYVKDSVNQVAQAIG